jgi:hypothetical protein
MAVLGLLAVVVGMFIGLSSPIAYNGQWLLGLICSIGGVALVALHTTIKEKK